ncbi:hypothetical protein Bbelb_435930 [Branchiostoma belcheri]|nr:hypothetical protein Bbelb_435930 [Branchiostoma belcheri]
MPDLGVIIQSDLQWDGHIAKMVARANSMTGFIKRTIGFNANTDVLWNNLGPDLRNLGVLANQLPNISAFKRQLVKVSFTRFNEHFSPDAPCSWSSACGCASCTALRRH